MHRLTGKPLSDLVKSTSWNQAQSLGLEGLGKIAPGFTADMVLLDDDFNTCKVFIDGVENTARNRAPARRTGRKPFRRAIPLLPYSNVQHSPPWLLPLKCPACPTPCTKESS